MAQCQPQRQPKNQTQNQRPNPTPRRDRAQGKPLRQASSQTERPPHGSIYAQLTLPELENIKAKILAQLRRQQAAGSPAQLRRKTSATLRAQLEEINTAQHNRLRKIKAQVMHLEANNHQYLIVYNSTDGYYKLAGRSVLFYTTLVITRLKWRANVRPDTDLYYPSQEGIVSIKDLERLEANLALLGILPDPRPAAFTAAQTAPKVAYSAEKATGTTSKTAPLTEKAAGSTPQAPQPAPQVAQAAAATPLLPELHFYKLPQTYNDAKIAKFRDRSERERQRLLGILRPTGPVPELYYQLLELAEMAFNLLRGTRGQHEAALIKSIFVDNVDAMLCDYNIFIGKRAGGDLFYLRSDYAHAWIEPSPASPQATVILDLILHSCELHDRTTFLDQTHIAHRHDIFKILAKNATIQRHAHNLYQELSAKDLAKAESEGAAATKVESKDATTTKAKPEGAATAKAILESAKTTKVSKTGAKTNVKSRSNTTAKTNTKTTSNIKHASNHTKITKPTRPRRSKPVHPAQQRLF